MMATELMHCFKGLCEWKVGLGRGEDFDIGGSRRRDDLLRGNGQRENIGDVCYLL